MALSKTKRDKIERARRQAEVNRRSLNGKGYFMDANWEAVAKLYVETGDESLLARLPLPRKERN